MKWNHFFIIKRENLVKFCDNITLKIKEVIMKTVAIMAIIVEDRNSAENINKVLHEYRDFIIGRMGLPYSEKKISIISIILDAPKEKIEELSKKIEEVPSVSSNTLYSMK